MSYRPIMNPIDVPDARRQPVMQPQTQQGGDRQKVMQALMSPAQSSMIFGRNFEGMFSPPEQQMQQPMEMPQNMGQGVAQMGNAFAHRQRQKQGAFPKAPGNNPMTGFGRLMGLFSKPGLY